VFRYVPYEQLGGESNIIVGGRATDGTTEVITPWASNNAATTTHDTAIGITLDLLRRNSFAKNCQAVSSDCFSADALVSMFALIQPQLALEMETTLIAVARTANYQIGEDRDAAHISFVLKAWTEPVDSPLNEGVFRESETAIANVLFEELLPRLAKIIERIDHFEPYWRKGEEHLTLTEMLLDTGVVQVTNDESLDLAQVTIAENEYKENGRLFQHRSARSQSLHQMGIHNATPHWRVLLQAGQKGHFYYRNESLSAYHRGRTEKQKDLSILAQSLNCNENRDGKWQATPPGSGNCLADPPPAALTLTSGADSNLAPEVFHQIVKKFLIT
jgi:hypothetical protein